MLSDELSALVCECLRQAPDGALPLSSLGTAVRELATRRGLRCSGGEAKLAGGLSQVVKAAWGGWDGFARARAHDGLRFADGVLRVGAERSDAGSSAALAAGEPGGMQTTASERATAYADARVQLGAVPSRSEVEALSLDSL